MTNDAFSWLEAVAKPVSQREAARDAVLFDRLALRNVPSEEYTHAGSKAGRQALSQGAPFGPELERVLSLPRRDWREAYDVPALVEQYTRLMRVKGDFDPTLDDRGNPRASLLPMQAVALHELATYGRLYIVAGLGTGKTLLSGLAPTLIDCVPEDTLYIPPAKLVDKTCSELAKLYIDGWRVCIPRNIVSAEEFSTRGCESLLEKLAPRCIVLDESHTFGNVKSGRSKRMDAFVGGTNTARTPTVITLTGTPGSDSLNSVTHLMRWSLGAANAPVPMTKSEAWVWCQCLDADTGFDKATKKQRRRPPPGELVRLLETGTEPTLDAVRDAVGRRIESTPGVFYYRIDDVAAGLAIDTQVFRGHSRTLREEFAAARAGDELTDGRVLDVPVVDKVLFETLGLGFARTIDPPPPQEWRDARTEYNSLIREILDDESYGLHTPGQVAARFASGEFQDPGAYSHWQAMRPTFEVHHKLVWLDEGALRDAAARAASYGEGCIVWCAYPAFARKLSSLTGMKFFHQQGQTAAGESIDDYKPAAGESVILSIQANATGRNLQTWSRNLIVGCPAKSDLLQQLIGRTHRRGQLAERVTVDVYVASIENALALHRARSRAQVDRTIGRALQSRLLDCEWLAADVVSLFDVSDPVWSSRNMRLNFDAEEDRA